VQLKFVRFNHPVTDPSFKGSQQADASDSLDISLVEDDFVQLVAKPDAKRKQPGRTILVPMSNVSYMVPAEEAPAKAAPAAPRPPFDVPPSPAPEAKPEPKAEPLYVPPPRTEGKPEGKKGGKR